MTELAIQVRLKADGSGLVGQLRLSAEESEKLTDAIKKTGAAAKGMAGDTAQAERAAEELATATRQAGAAAQAMVGDQRQAAAAVGSTAKGLRESSQAANDNQRAMARHAQGMRSAGQQVADVAVMIQGGVDPGRAFATQITQIGYALSDMQGRAGKVGAFLTGPYGIALSVAAGFAAPLVSSMFQAETAADAAKTGASGLADAQSVLGEIFDLTSGKIKSQNELLILNARLTAINMRSEALRARTSSRQTFGDADELSTGERGKGAAQGLTAGVQSGALAFGLPGIIAAIGRSAFGAYTGTSAGRQRADTIGALARDVQAGRVSSEAAMRRSETLDFTGSKVTREQFQQALIDDAAGEAKQRVADLIDQSLDDGKLVAGLRKASTKKPSKPKKPASTAARDEFGRDAEDRVASILSQFDDTPSAVRQANAAVRQLDDLMEDLARRKPPGFEATIASAERAKDVVEASVTRPFDDFIDAQEEQLRIGRLVAQGREGEADALRATLQLQRQMGELTPDQLADVRAITAQLREQERAAERTRARQQMQLAVLGDIRSTIAQTIYEGPGSITALPERLLDAFKRGAAEMITERLFGGVLEQLKDEVLGADTVQSAATRMGSAVDDVSTSLYQLKGAVDAAAGQEPDIVVQGKREKRESLTLTGLFGKALTGLAKGVGIGDDAAKKIGSFAGRGVAGAFEGQAAASVAGMLGMRTSGGGAAIGGAIGGLTGLPGGSLVGGLAGGLLGGLFGTKKDYGTATLTGAGDAAIGGNAGSAKSGASGLAESVQDGLQRIADQLGGQLGSYLVSIGTYDGDYRVSTSGQSGELSFGKKNKNKATLRDFGDDQGAALAFAMGDAIADGAITGLSPAVAKALRSSTDVDKALAEALKVQEVEELIGGIGYTLAKVFDDADDVAKERVRIAKAYGLDVLAVEKANAEQRAKLIEETLRSRVGALTQLRDEMAFGDLYEGTAADRRDGLLERIAAVQAKAEAGEDGAADQLAGLFQQLLGTTREDFGTAGAEYAGDRALVSAGLQRVIELENGRVQAAATAQAATTKAVETVATLTNESNDLLAMIGSGIADLNAAVARLRASTPTADAAGLIRAIG